MIFLTFFLLAWAFAQGAFATTYYVSAGGLDTNSGTSPSLAWRTLQHAADRVVAGDRVIVLAGTYRGFHLSRSGRFTQPITFQADPTGGAPNPQVILSGNNAFTNRDTINLEGASHVVIEGFTILGTGDPSTHRAGVRAVGTASRLASHVTVRDCRVDRAGTWGIFTGFVDDARVERCEVSRSAEEHGIYLSNSGDRPIVRDCVLWGNHSNGLHMNGDASLGNDGVISNALIERNVVHENGDGDPRYGAPGGSGINADGVVDSTFRNNLLYDNHKSGLSLYRIDGGAPSTGNLVVNNTIVNAGPSRWCLNLKNASANNRVLNNILYNRDVSRGAIDVSSDCLPGFVCDWNVVEDRFSLDDQWIDLSTWRARTSQDAHSLVATPTALFVDEANDDYRLRTTSPALDRGTPTGAPDHDLVRTPRPAGAGFDVGAYERPVCGSTSNYGAGLAGSSGFVPRVAVTGCVTPGGSFTIAIDQGLGGAPAVLVIGASARSLSLFGGTLLVSPDVLVAHGLGGALGMPGAGSWSIGFVLPQDPALVSVGFHLQEFVVDAGAVQGVAMSAGLEVVIGD